MNEFAPFAAKMGNTTAINNAANAIKNYGKQLYEESEQYEKDTKALKEHKDELEELNKKYKQLETDLEKSTTKKQSKEIQTELKKVGESIEKTKTEIIEDENTIVENTKKAFESMSNDIRDSVQSTIDPMKTSLNTQIELFKKFGGQTEVSVKEVLGNMKSQIEGVKQWNADLALLADKGFATGLLEELRDMGPSGSNYVKAFLSMTTKEMEEANGAFTESSLMTTQALSTNFEKSMEDAKLWADNMGLLAKRGLNQGLLEALSEKGVNGAEYVSAFLTMTPEQIAAINKQFEECLTIPDTVANKLSATLAFAGIAPTEGVTEPLNAEVRPDSPESKVIGDNATLLGATAVTNISDGAKSKEEELKTAASNLGKAFYDALSAYLSEEKGKLLGGYICQGIVTGLQNNESYVKEEARTIARNTYNAAKEELGIASPSKAFAELGMYAVRGLAKGLRDYSAVATKASTSLGNQAIAGLKASIARIGDVVNGDLNLSPTIRPVLDFTELRRGVSTVDGLFSGGRTMHLATLNRQIMSASATMGQGQENGRAEGTNNHLSFVQNNYSPTALSRIDIYRQTKNQFSTMKGLVNGT